jgi:hypothetical protein
MTKQDYPRLMGCLGWLATFAVTYGILALITIFAGVSAAFWFALGGLITGIIAIWDAGGSAKVRSQSPTSTEESPHTPAAVDAGIGGAA